jgi:hypothetical protein
MLFSVSFYVLSGFLAFFDLNSIIADVYQPSTCYSLDANLSQIDYGVDIYNACNTLVWTQSAMPLAQIGLNWSTSSLDDCKKSMWILMHMDPFWSASYTDTSELFSLGNARNSILKDIKQYCENNKNIDKIKQEYAPLKKKIILLNENNIDLIGPYLFLEVLYANVFSDKETGLRHPLIPLPRPGIQKKKFNNSAALLRMHNKLKEIIINNKNLSADLMNKIKLSYNFTSYFIFREKKIELDYNRIIKILHLSLNNNSTSVFVDNLEKLIGFKALNAEEKTQLFKPAEEISCKLINEVKKLDLVKSPYDQYCAKRRRHVCFRKHSKSQLNYTMLMTLKEVLGKEQYVNNCKK